LFFALITIFVRAINHLVPHQGFKRNEQGNSSLPLQWIVADVIEYPVPHHHETGDLATESPLIHQRFPDTAGNETVEIPKLIYGEAGIRYLVYREQRLRSGNNENGDKTHMLKKTEVSGITHLFIMYSFPVFLNQTANSGCRMSLHYTGGEADLARSDFIQDCRIGTGTEQSFRIPH
jgi:hypothetical protein